MDAGAVNTKGFMFLRCPPNGPKNSGHRHGHKKHPKEKPWVPVQPEPPHSQHAQHHLVTGKQGDAACVLLTSCLAAVDLFICLHTNRAGLGFEFCLFSIFVGQQILLQLLEQATADRVTEQQCKLWGKAEELRAPAVARVFSLAFRPILITLVFF